MNEHINYTELFAPYKIAHQLKDKGFNGKCFCSYRNSDGEEMLLLNPCKNTDYFITANDDNCAAPLYHQVLIWFLKEHDLSIEYSTSVCSYTCSIVKNQITNVYFEMDFKTPLDSIKNGIAEALKLI